MDISRELSHGIIVNLQKYNLLTWQMLKYNLLTWQMLKYNLLTWKMLKKNTQRCFKVF